MYVKKWTFVCEHKLWDLGIISNPVMSCLSSMREMIFFSKPDHFIKQYIFIPHVYQMFLKRSEDLSVTPTISEKESTMELKLAPLKATMSVLFCGEKRPRKTRHGTLWSAKIALVSPLRTIISIAWKTAFRILSMMPFEIGMCLAFAAAAMICATEILLPLTMRNTNPLSLVPQVKVSFAVLPKRQEIPNN